MKKIVIMMVVSLLTIDVGSSSLMAHQTSELAFSNENVNPGTVTQLTGFYRHGQVFLTWTNGENSNNHYKVYRSLIQIRHGSQLSQCEYLGLTTQLSAKDVDLTYHYGTTFYLRIDSAGNPLDKAQGLFVATTLVKGNYFYAVTIELNGVEDTTIAVGVNAFSLPISEQVSVPQPVFQQMIQVAGKPVEFYTNFFSTKIEISSPPILSAGWLPTDFSLYRNNNNGNQPLCVQMHGGGGDLFTDIDLVTSNEMNLNFESNFPNGEDVFNWGANSNYDIWHITGNIPSSGTDYNFMQWVYKQTIDWAIANLRIDSNRIYLSGTSAGACGAYSYAITYPEKIAAVHLGVPCFNIGFQNDSVPASSFNTANREKVDKILGLVSSDLPSNLGFSAFEVLNGGWRIHQSCDKDFPFIYAMNGKHDVMVGWTEKTVYYDSVNINAPGGYYFWDGRTHDGGGSFWQGNYFDIFRFRRNVSYPAFSNCSLNENYGNGSPTSGADYGSVNGALNWADPIIDNSEKWELTFFIRNLTSLKGGTVKYPDSATVDITPRRLQQFHVPLNTKFYWSVTHNSQIIQSDSGFHEEGAITIRGIKVFKDSVKFSLWYSSSDTSTSDTDGDGYTVAQGDCNDHNAKVHPGATDVCNGIDDNCNGTTDENKIIATVSPGGNISICKGSDFTLTANSGAGISYQWLKNGVLIPNATNQTYSPTKAASYSVKENNSFSCSSTSAATSVTIFSLPTATITPLSNINICITGSVGLQANGGSNLSYQWKKGNNNIAGATNQIYTATTIGSYRVDVSNNNDCSRTSAAAKVTKSCKENVTENNEVTSTLGIYPNPSSGAFNIEIRLNSENNSEVIVQIINMNGQIMQTEKFPVEKGLLLQKIQSNLVAGTYLVNVITNDQMFQERLVITE